MLAPATPREETGNLLLASLPPEEFAQLAPHLSRVRLESGDRLYGPEEAAGFIHFPEGGLLSLLTTPADGTSIEVAALGREGPGGLLVLLGSSLTAHTATVQVGSTALRLRTERARECFHRLPFFRARLLRYARLLLAHVSQTAACNTLHTVGERLARWLLLGRLRLGSDRLPLTQEFLSQMLGVRRSGVTLAVGALEQAGLLRHGRGSLTVTDPEGLGETSCGCAAVMADEYAAFVAELADG